MTQIIKLHGINGGDIERLSESLRRGSLACLPTDTVYGLAGTASREVAEKIHSVKGRDPQKPLALVFDSVQQIPMALVGGLWPIHIMTTVPIMIRSVPGLTPAG